MYAIHGLLFLKNHLTKLATCDIILNVRRGIAQLVEYWSPKPWVVGSSPSAPAKAKSLENADVLSVFRAFSFL